MTLTLAWKEMREHQGIWLTMVFMTVVLGTGLSKIVALGDPGMAVPTAAFTIFGMAAAYGIVCGSMMFAGEHEGGTLVFLDIFLGRRGRLWAGKVAIGTVLVLTESLAVAAILNLLQQEPPGWALALVGYGDAIRPGFGARLDPRAWFLVLPVMSLEAYAWGLLGSSLTKRVLAGAAVAAVGFTPVWLLALLASSPCFLGLRVVLAVVLLAFSLANFLRQTDEVSFRPPPRKPIDPKKQFLERWEQYEDDDFAEERPAYETPASAAPIYPTVANDGTAEQPAPSQVRPRLREPELEQAKSPSEVLWWLTLQQAWPLFWTMTGGALLIGFIIHTNTQVLWPLMTLLIGVACGVAAFAPEQRDLSYQFLAAQHFPLHTIWRFKILFWLAVAGIETLTMAFGNLLLLAMVSVHLHEQGRVRPGLSGTLRDLMGPMLFFGVWLLYGFCAGQLVVWLCRKNILALLASSLVAATALGMWLPSLLCGGMNGWQLWAPPLILLLATWFLMRAWAGGRIMERKPLAALIGFGAAIVVWALLNFGYRAWECPDVGAPVDVLAFKASLLDAKDNAAAKAIHKAIAEFENRGRDRADLFFWDERWGAPFAEASRLPVGVLETPRADGQAPQLKHLPTCQKMSDELLREVRAEESGPAFEHLSQILALSRNLRNKAPVESYLAGIQMESGALNGLDLWLARGKPDLQQLRRVVDELNRHANETPPPLDCLHTECFRSNGAVANPNAWTLPDDRDHRGERWLAGSIALSYEMPWEAERKMRIWQLVWAGLFRAVETPHWQLPESSEMPAAKKRATRDILQCWLPAPSGPGASISRADMIHLLDTSWLADDRLFCSIAPLRDAAIRARWRVDATRLALALSLYRLEEGKSANDLQGLAPKYFPAGLPMDPYSGQSFGYRIAPKTGQAFVWSTGPDRIDHGGIRHGGHLFDHDPQWARGDFDLIKMAPQWP